MPPRKRASRNAKTSQVLQRLVKHRLPKDQPPHPGEILRDDFLTGWGITAPALARHLGIPASRLHAVLRGKRALTASDALRLARVLGTPADYWLTLQQGWDLWHAIRSAEGRAIRKLRPISRKASRSLTVKAKEAEKKLANAARERLGPLQVNSRALGRRVLGGLKEALAAQERRLKPAIIRQYQGLRRRVQTSQLES